MLSMMPQTTSQELYSGSRTMLCMANIPVNIMALVLGTRQLELRQQVRVGRRRPMRILHQLHGIEASFALSDDGCWCKLDVVF